MSPLSCGRRRRRRPRVSTTRRPPEASTAPATTRSPLPSAPRVGSRSSLDDTSGRRIENSRAMSAGSPAIPGPSSSTYQPPSSSCPPAPCRRHRARCRPAPSAPASAGGGRGTPAFWLRVESERNSVQSSRSNVNSGDFVRAGRLAEAAAECGGFFNPRCDRGSQLSHSARPRAGRVDPCRAARPARCAAHGAASCDSRPLCPGSIVRQSHEPDHACHAERVRRARV